MAKRQRSSGSTRDDDTRDLIANKEEEPKKPEAAPHSPVPSEIAIDTLDLARLIELATAFRDHLEEYQRAAEANDYRLGHLTVGTFGQCGFSVLYLEAELARLGLGPPPAASATRWAMGDRGGALLDLRELLMEARGWKSFIDNPAHWGSRVGGIWAPGRGDPLPDLAPFLRLLEEILRHLNLTDLHAKADAPPAESVAGTGGPLAERPASPPLTDIEYAVLQQLYRVHPQLIKITDLALSHLDCRRSAAGEAVRSLESQGLVSRPRGERSGVVITPAGRAALRPCDLPSERPNPIVKRH
jgi:DNA-binding MarR family transcriptional regulator